jgi:hypothetical protein
LVIGLAAIPAHAQTAVRAKVPFNFVVSDKTFAAGDYTIVINPHQVNVEDDRGLTVAVVLANEISGHSVGQQGQLLFHCYSDRCVLSEVWSSARQNGRQLLTQRVEAELAKEEPAKYFAVSAEERRK